MNYVVRKIHINLLYNKRVCPNKNEPQQQGISYLERETKGVRERERVGGGGSGPAGRQAGRLKVRVSFGDKE